MDNELNEADKALDVWMEAQAKADLAATRHKHKTAAQIAVLSEDQGVTKAKELVYATDEWLERQTYCDGCALKAQAAKMAFEQAIRRFEAARSYFSAGRKVA